MPLPTPSKGEDQDAFISRCMSNPTTRKEFPGQKQRSAVCFSQWRRKGKESCSEESYEEREEGGKEMNLKENVRFKFSTPFNVISEGIEEDTSKRKIRGTMLKATTSRNGRKYTMEEIRKAKFSSDTLSLNHTEDVEDNIGIFKPVPTETGFDFEATVFNTIRHPGVIDMLDKGLIKFASIEAIAKEVERDPEEESLIVRGLDITGLGLVKTPGIPEATVAIAEAFEKACSEKVSSEEEKQDDSEEESEENLGGNTMTEKVLKEQEEPQEEETTEETQAEESKEQPKEEAKIAPSEPSPESLAIKKLSEEIQSLKSTVTKLSSKGVTAPTKEAVPNLVTERNKDNTISFYPTRGEEFY